MPYENTKINYAFLRRLKHMNGNKFADMIKKGLNPFAEVDQRDQSDDVAGPFDGGPDNLFLHALYLDQDDVVTAMLRWTELQQSLEDQKPSLSERKEYLVDLSKPVPIYDHENDMPMSMLQYAAKFCSPELTTELIKYQEKHFPPSIAPNRSVDEILNEKFRERVENDDGTHTYRVTTLPLSILENISIHKILFGNTISANSEDEKSKIRNSLHAWLFLRPNQPMINLPVNQIKLIINGQNVVLVNLLVHLLALDGKRPSDSKTAERVLRELVEAQKSPETLLAYFKKLKLDKYRVKNVCITPNSQHPTALDITFTNIFYAHPVTITCILNHAPAEKLIELAAKKISAVPIAAAINQVKQTQAAHGQLLSQHTSEIEQVKRDLHSLSEQAYKDALAKIDSPFWCDVFYVLHKLLESFIRQKGDASLNIVKSLPDTERWMKQQVAVALFQLTGNALPKPFDSILPNLAQAALTAHIEHDKNQQNATIFAIRLTPYEQATFICSRVVAQAMLRLGQDHLEEVAPAKAGCLVPLFSKVQQHPRIVDDLFRLVKQQYLVMHKHRFGDAVEAMTFACHKVMTDPILRLDSSSSVAVRSERSNTPTKAGSSVSARTGSGNSADRSPRSAGALVARVG